VWYLTLHRWVGERERAIAECLGPHLDWMREQQLTGKVLMAGPSADFEFGIIVFGDMAETEVEDLCRHEPFVANGHRDYEVIPWAVHHVLGIGGFDTKTVGAMVESEHIYRQGTS
jgi:uncharacterized protein YciI